MNNDIIDFEIHLKNEPDIAITGYAYASELDDEEPLTFLNNRGLNEGTHVPSNPYDHHLQNESWNAYEKLAAAFQTDDLFLDCLSTHADENKTVDRGNYFIDINKGAKFEVEIEEIPVEENPDFFMGFKIKFNGKQVFLEEDAVFIDPYTDEETKVSEMWKEFGFYIVEFPKQYWEDKEQWEEDKSILNDYKDAFERAYVQSLSKELGVYGTAYGLIKEELLNGDNPVEAMNEGYIDKRASIIEQAFEESELRELYFMSDETCEKMIKEMLHERG